MPSSIKIIVFSVNSTKADAVIYLCMLHYRKAFVLVYDVLLIPQANSEYPGEEKNFCFLSVCPSKLVFPLYRERRQRRGRRRKIVALSIIALYSLPTYSP